MRTWDETTHRLEQIRHEFYLIHQHPEKEKELEPLKSQLRALRSEAVALHYERMRMVMASYKR